MIIVDVIKLQGSRVLNSIVGVTREQMSNCINCLMLSVFLDLNLITLSGLKGDDCWELGKKFG